MVSSTKTENTPTHQESHGNRLLGYFFAFGAFFVFVSSQIDWATELLFGSPPIRYWRAMLYLPPYSFWNLLTEYMMVFLFLGTAVAIALRAPWAILVARIVAIIFLLQMLAIMVLLPLGGFGGIFDMATSWSWGPLRRLRPQTPVMLWALGFAGALALLTWIPRRRRVSPHLIPASITIVYGAANLVSFYDVYAHGLAMIRGLIAGSLTYAVQHLSQFLPAIPHAIYTISLFAIALALVQRSQYVDSFIGLSARCLLAFGVVHVIVLVSITLPSSGTGVSIDQIIQHTINTVRMYLLDDLIFLGAAYFYTRSSTFDIGGFLRTNYALDS